MVDSLRSPARRLFSDAGSCRRSPIQCPCRAEYPPGFVRLFTVCAERQAFDAALPVLHVLPPDLRDRSRNARSQILIMMHIDEILEMVLTKDGAPPTSVVQKRLGLIQTLPNELDDLADAIDTFVKTDCEARWFRSRSASRH